MFRRRRGGRRNNKPNETNTGDFFIFLFITTHYIFTHVEKHTLTRGKEKSRENSLLGKTTTALLPADETNF